MSFEAAPAAGKNFQTILAGRKCYRMSKDKNEVVWPPHLEAALMEGLEKYTPAESKSPRGLTRFPNRNKFIAEYIRNKTGEVRTAKQVGSRIQQLRDTSAGKTIMKAISDRHYEMMHPSRPSSEAPSHDDYLASIGMGGSMNGASGMYFESAMAVPTNQIIHVYISVPHPSSSSPHSGSHSMPTSAASSPALSASSASSSWVDPSSGMSGGARQTEVSVLSSAAYAWGEPRPLRAIDPTVTFSTPAPLMLWSSFTVCCGSMVVHVDPARPMRMRQASAPGAGYLHGAVLAPGYWDALCSCADVSAYVIIQEISKADTAPGAKPDATVPVRLIYYHFSTAGAPPLSPFALEDELEVEYDYESDEMLNAPRAAHALPPLSGTPDSPYGGSERDSSPAYSLAGLCSQPLSPVDWTASAPGAGAGAWGYGSSAAAAYGPSASMQQQQQQQQYGGLGVYGVQQPPQQRGYLHAGF